jgi:signal transduction histidine kinase
MPVIAFSTTGAVGALILARDRGNRIGGLLLWAAVTVSIAFATSEATTYSLSAEPFRLPATQWLTWLASTMWLTGITPMVFALPILFPTGRPASRTWATVLAMDGVLMAIAFLSVAVATDPFTWNGQDVANPLFVPWLAWIPALDRASGLFLVVFVTGVVAVVARYRRATEDERLQIRWLAFAVSVLFAYLLFSELSSFAEEHPLLDSVLSGLGFLAIPVAIGVAVFRYHLYDLDLVVKRTLLYAILVALATAVYVAIVVGVGAWLGSESSFLTIVAAVSIAVGFQPARARLTRFVDRLVYGARATPYEVLSEFSHRVGDTYASDDMLPRMARVLAEGTGAERADVWLRVGDELRVRASWPPGGDAAEAPARTAYEVSYPVRYHGETLGALSIRKAPTDPVRSAEDKLVQDLAAQAGLVLRNHQLTARLEAQVEELRGLQKRLVAAQDHERRRLERNIHDGAQQQLVALAIEARMARRVLDTDTDRAAALIERLEAGAQEALEGLRDLARGIYPPLLADQGLAAALEAQARRSPVEVDVVSTGLERYPLETEAGVYFCCSEAIQNAAKHAPGARVTVELVAEGDELSFVVADDGPGFDPVSNRPGSGLRGMADRLAALNGSFEIESAPGAGTVVRGRIPVGTTAREEVTVR